MKHTILVVGGLLVSISLNGMELGKVDKQLLKAAKQNKPFLLKWALWRGANPNVADSTQATPLHYYASRSDTESLRLLIQHGALVNVVTARKLTPLHVAISHNATLYTIVWLLDNGVHVDAQDEDGNTPLHCAVALHNDAVAKVLVQRGALVDMVNHKGLLPEHIDFETTWNAFYTFFKKAVLDSKIQLTDFFLSRGAQLDFIAPTGGTPVHWGAACLKAHKMLPLLLNHALKTGVEPQRPSKLHVLEHFLNKQDLDGQTPLHWAAATRNFLSWKLLLRYGARLDIQNNNEDTPLHLLAVEYHEDGDSDDSLDDTFCEFLNCPIGSRVELESDVIQSSDRIFTFLCCLHRIKTTTGLQLPRDVLHKILREYLLDDLSLVPLGSYYKNMKPADIVTCTGFRLQCMLSDKTKYQKKYAEPIVPKLKLFGQLLTRHQEVLKKVLCVKNDERNRLLAHRIKAWLRSYEHQRELMLQYAQVIRTKKLKL